MKSKRRSHVRCSNIKVKRKCRRGRRGKKSSLYTRFRCDPDPWQGSPPQTPPSSDDESNDVALKSNINHCNKLNQNKFNNNRRNHQQHYHMHNNHNNHNHNHNNNNNNNINNNIRSVAPAPLNNRKMNTINQVRRNLNEYIRMENVNVIQSRQQCISQKTTLTAPAPPKLQFKKSLKNQIVNVKCSKQTAPVPINKSIINNKNIINKNIENNASFQMTAFAKPFIPKKPIEIVEKEEMNDVNDMNDMIDVALIPEAYFVGCEGNVNNKCNNSNNNNNENNKENIQGTNHDMDLNFDFDFDNDSLIGESIEFDDSLHSQSTVIEQIDQKHYVTPPRAAIFSDDDQDTLFDDSKFYLLAEEILDEHEDDTAWKFAKNSPYAQQRTLGGLLMHGIPPINATKLFQNKE